MWWLMFAWPMRAWPMGAWPLGAWPHGEFKTRISIRDVFANAILISDGATYLLSIGDSE